MGRPRAGHRRCRGRRSRVAAFEINRLAGAVGQGSKLVLEVERAAADRRRDRRRPWEPRRALATRPRGARRRRSAPSSWSPSCPGDLGFLGDALRFEVPKTVHYWLSAIAAAGAAAALAHVWARVTIPSLARAAAFAFVVVAALPLRLGNSGDATTHGGLRSDRRLPPRRAPLVGDIRDRPALRGDSGFWVGFPDSRTVVDAPRQELLDAVRAEIAAGRLRHDTEVLHVARDVPAVVSDAAGRVRRRLRDVAQPRSRGRPPDRRRAALREQGPGRAPGPAPGLPRDGRYPTSCSSRAGCRRAFPDADRGAGYAPIFGTTRRGLRAATRAEVWSGPLAHAALGATCGVVRTGDGGSGHRPGAFRCPRPLVGTRSLRIESQWTPQARSTPRSVRHPLVRAELGVRTDQLFLSPRTRRRRPARVDHLVAPRLPHPARHLPPACHRDRHPGPRHGGAPAVARPSIGLLSPVVFVAIAAVARDVADLAPVAAHGAARDGPGVRRQREPLGGRDRHLAAQRPRGARRGPRGGDRRPGPDARRDLRAWA